MFKRHFSIFAFAYSTSLFFLSISTLVIAQERNPEFLSPLFFSGIILIMGFMSRKEDLHLFGKHGATALSLVAFVFSISGVLDLQNPDLFIAAVVKSATALISLLFLIIFVKKISFDRKTIITKNGNNIVFGLF